MSWRVILAFQMNKQYGGIYGLGAGNGTGIGGVQKPFACSTGMEISPIILWEQQY